MRSLVGAVSRMERSRSPKDLRRAAASLQDWLQGPKDGELRRAFADWLWRLARRLQPEGAAADSPPGLDLEDVRMTLDEMEMSLEERVAQWPKPWIQKGIEQGLEHERALLRRLASLRFGADAAERASALLQRITDPDRLEEVGELIVRCETGSDFLARINV